VRASVIALAALAVAAAASRAAAAPDDVIARPLVLAPGALEAGLTLEVGLSTRLVGKPISLAPDLYWGVTDRLTVGVVHSARALSLVNSGDGICFGGVDHGCEQAYSNLGLDARWSLATGARAAAAHVRLVARRWSPWLPSLRLGAVLRWRRGRFAVVADPYVQLGLLHRDQGNRAILDLPVWLAVQPTCRWEAYLRTGARGEWAVFRDAWQVPVAVGVKARVSDRVDVAAEAGFEQLGGPLNTAKPRAGWLGVDVRWP
jgi:hypothetical protein